MPRGIPLAGRNNQQRAATGAKAMQRTGLGGRTATGGMKAATPGLKRAGAGGRDEAERLRPIGRQQTLTETIANIAVRAQQPMDTVRRVLQATQRVAEGIYAKADRASSTCLMWGCSSIALSSRPGRRVCCRFSAPGGRCNCGNSRRG